MTSAEYRKLHGLPPPGHDHHTNHHHRVPHPKPQQGKQDALGSTQEGQGSSDGRTVVRITEHSVHIKDSDNFVGGLKHLVDALRYNGDIIDDSPKHIILETHQVKVAHYHEEYIEILIIKP